MTELEMYQEVQREALHAWALEFQSGGRFHKVSNLELGDSIIVRGGAWLVSEWDRLTKELQDLQNKIDQIRVVIKDD